MSGESIGVRLVEALALGDEDDPLPRLREVPADDIIRAAFTTGAVPNGPVIDGHIVPEAPHTVFAAGRQTPRPLLVGSTNDETTVLPWQLGPQMADIAAWRSSVNTEYGEDAAEIIAAYDSTARRDVRAAQRALTQFALFHAPVANDGARNDGRRTTYLCVRP